MKGFLVWQSARVVGRKQPLVEIDPGRRKQLCVLFAQTYKKLLFMKKGVKFGKYSVQGASAHLGRLLNQINFP